MLSRRDGSSENPAATPMRGELSTARTCTVNAGRIQPQRIRRTMHARFARRWIRALVSNESEFNMPSYDFSVIIAARKMSHERILDATDALGAAGCTDGRCADMRKAW